MSRRALRKVQADSTLLNEFKANVRVEKEVKSNVDVVAVQSEDDGQEEEEEEKLQYKNPFEVLHNDQTPSDNEAKEDDDQEQDLDDDNKDAKEQSSATDSLKRKKRKKRKKKQVEVKDVSGEEDEKSDRGCGGGDDVDAVFLEVQEMMGETSKESRRDYCASSSSSQTKGIFTVDFRNLIPKNELRRIFGSKVVQGDSGKRRTARGRHHLKSCKLVTPRQNWPHLGKLGLTMTLVETKGGLYYFRFEHSSQYRQIQFQFLDAVESLDPSNITAVLNGHPYHIDALLQLSEIVRLGEEVQIAVELIERAIYSFENSFHTLFNVATGNCRLDYRYDENRSFYVALFKHLTFIGQRGCYRTALEFCKVLLGLDPEGDPLGVFLMIDFYAIKSGEYTYFLNLYETLEVARNLSQLPNFAFSEALARFHQSDDYDEASKRLQNALMAFPAVLLPLLDKCGVQADARVLKHNFFSTTTCELSHPPALCTLIRLYVGRCFHLWKEPEVMSWLEAVVKDVLDRVDREDPLVAFYTEKRKVRYQGMPRNIYRHILLSDIKDATTALPPEMAGSTVLSFDPLPPTDRILSYTRPERLRQQSDGSFLQVLFQSLFPQYTIQEAQQRRQGPGMAIEAGNAGAVNRPAVANGVRGQGDAAHADFGAVGGAVPNVDGGEQQTQAFRQSVTQVLDAMRDLISNFQMAEVGQDVDADDSDNEID